MSASSPGPGASRWAVVAGVVIGVALTYGALFGLLFGYVKWSEWRIVRGEARDEKELAFKLQRHLEVGRKCHLQRDRATGECRYALGGLDLALAGVGRDNAAFIVEGDLSRLTVRRGAAERCVTVAFVEKPWVSVYVSPANATVYEQASGCERASGPPIASADVPESLTPGRAQGRRPP